MIDDLLRPIGPGPRPPSDGFARAVQAGRRKRWKTLRNNAACMTAAFAAVVAALMPRLATTSFAGLEPTTPTIRTHPAPQGTSAATPTPTPSPTTEPPAPQAIPERDAPDQDGPAGYARPGYAPAASRGPAGPQAEGTPAPYEEGTPDYGEPQPAPEPTAGPPATQPADPPPPSPSPSPQPEDPGPEPVDLSYEDQSVNATCQGSTWCWSVQASGSYTFRLKACRGASDTTGILTFDAENETDFRVLRDGNTVWQWSLAQDDPAYVHEVFVDRWECAVWTTRWHGFDSAGDPVPPGTYRLDALCRATNVPAVWRGTSFTVT